MLVLTKLVTVVTGKMYLYMPGQMHACYPGHSETLTQESASTMFSEVFH